MIRTCLSTAALAIFALSLAGCAGSRTNFGEPMKLAEADTVDVSTVLQAPDKYDGEYVRVSGRVAEVCSAKGCWINLKDWDTGREIHVQFTCPMEGRLIPMEAKGRKAIVEGVLEITEISEEAARHFAEEGGKTPEEIAAIKGPQRQYRIESPAAVVFGLSKA